MTLPQRTALIALLTAATTAHAGDLLTQVSTYKALADGGYGAVTTYADLGDAGDTGIGTFTGINGEMIMVDGVIYRVDVSGTVAAMPASSGTPFCVLVDFEAERKLAVPSGWSMPELTAALAKALPTQANPVAIRISGRFDHILCRSVPGQSEPYPALGVVVAQQNTFAREGIDGTVVGFWFPAYMDGLNAPGFHLHFISADHTFGGHVLDLTTGNATASLDPQRELRVVLAE